MSALDGILVFTEHYPMGGDADDVSVDIEGMLYMFYRQDVLDTDGKLYHVGMWPDRINVTGQTMLRAKMLVARRVLINNNRAREFERVHTDTVPRL